MGLFGFIVSLVVSLGCARVSSVAESLRKYRYGVHG
jgi:hypothetical protein